MSPPPTITVEVRIDDLVPYKPLVRTYRLVNRYQKHTKHKGATNKYLPTNKPTLI